MKAESRKQKAEIISDLLRYPDGKLGKRVAAAIDALLDNRPALDEVLAFFDEVEHVQPDGLEELYTRTFDLDPVATLDLGWHLYGEQYERGRFLARLREAQAGVGIDSTPELPDHITAVLPLIAHTEDAALAGRVAPALEKILKTLDEQGNPYRHLIRAVQLVLDPAEVTC